MTNDEKQAKYLATVGANMRRVREYYTARHGEGHVKSDAMPLPSAPRVDMATWRR